MGYKLLFYLKVLLFSLVISTPVVLPYFQEGFFSSHDGEWAVVRLGDMFRSLRDGQFPVRYSGALNFGYGYPLFNFAYPLPYYLGVVIYVISGSFVVSIKTLFVLSVIFSSFFMFLASRILWKNNLSGIVSSILYVYMPYRMIDLYVRGSLGESISFVLFPLIFYISIKLSEDHKSRIIFVSLSILLASLIMTHNIMTVLFLPVLVVLVLGKIYIEKKFEALKYFCLSCILGLILAAFFWIPAILEKNNILLSIVPIANRDLFFVQLSQLIFPSWGFGSPDQEGGFSYHLGIAHILTMIICLVILLISRLNKKLIPRSNCYNYAILLVIIFISCAILLFDFSSVVWKTVPLLSEINYPWTLLSQLGFISSILVGYFVLGKNLKILAIMISLISIINVYPYARPRDFVDRGDNFYLTNEATTTSSNELMPLWVKKFPLNHFQEKVEVDERKVKISNINYNSKEINFDYSANSTAVIRVNTIYYPGWVASNNNTSVGVRYDNDFGVMTLDVMPGEGKIRIKFTETKLRIISNVISIAGLVILFFYILPIKKVNKLI